MWFEVEEKEREFLLALLDEALVDVRDEIYRAETHEFKDRLKVKKALIVGLIAKVRHAAEVAGIQG